MLDFRVRRTSQCFFSPNWCPYYLSKQSYNHFQAWPLVPIVIINFRTISECFLYHSGHLVITVNPFLFHGSSTWKRILKKIVHPCREEHPPLPASLDKPLSSGLLFSCFWSFPRLFLVSRGTIKWQRGGIRRGGSRNLGDGIVYSKRDTMTTAGEEEDQGCCHF